MVIRYSWAHDLTDTIDQPTSSRGWSRSPEEDPTIMLFQSETYKNFIETNRYNYC